MKKVLVILGILLAVAVGCNAQGLPFSLYVGGAVSIPTSPDGFKETYNTGYHGTLGAGYNFMPNFQIIGKAEYHRFSYDFADLSDIDGGANKLWMFGADGKFSLNAPVFPFKPFLFGGVGMAKMQFGEFSGDNLSLVTAYNDATLGDQSEFYYNIGVGGEYKMGPAWSFFVQARYVNVNTEGDAWVFVPVTLGLKFF